MANELEQPMEFWEEKKDKFKELTLPDFRTYYKATVRQCGVGKERESDQWSR